MRGVMEVISSIKDAEDVLRGSYEKKSGDFYNELPAGAVRHSEQADLFLKGRARTLEYTKLLKENPTGRSLIRHVLEEIENPKKEFYPNLRKFVVHGARFAQGAYGIVYPLAEKSLSLPREPLLQNLLCNRCGDVGAFSA